MSFSLGHGEPLPYTRDLEVDLIDDIRDVVLQQSASVHLLDHPQLGQQRDVWNIVHHAHSLLLRSDEAGLVDGIVPEVEEGLRDRGRHCRREDQTHSEAEEAQPDVRRADHCMKSVRDLGPLGLANQNPVQVLRGHDGLQNADVELGESLGLHLLLVTSSLPSL